MWDTCCVPGCGNEVKINDWNCGEAAEVQVRHPGSCRRTLGYICTSCTTTIKLTEQEREAAAVVARAQTTVYSAKLAYDHALTGLKGAEADLTAIQTQIKLRDRGEVL